MGPPPFSPSPDLARLVGVTGLGLMTFLVAKAEPALDVPGGWCVTGGVRELCAEVGWGSSKWAAETKALHAAGLIHIAPGMRLGRGGGSTSARYFLTHSPDLFTPEGPVGGSRFREAYFRDVHSGDTKGSGDDVIHRAGRHLIAAPLSQIAADGAGAAPLDVSGVETPSMSSAPDVVLNHQQQGVGVPGVAEPAVSTHAEAPGFVTRALGRLGWVGPPPAVADWELLAAVALHLEAQRGRFRNPPGFLAKLIEQNALVTFAQGERLPAATQDPPSAEAMPYEEYTELCMCYPEWERAVSVEAQRRAQLLGVPLTMFLKRAVALEIPHGGSKKGLA